LVASGGHVTASYLLERDATSLAGIDRVTAVRCDVTVEAEVQAMIDAMPRVDALVHLVGGFTMAPTDEMSLEAWRAHVDLQLTTTFLACKHALRRMRQTGHGRIVTIGSRAVDQPSGKTAAYSAGKAGVVALTRVIAAETKGSDVTANCVLPSIIDTPANRKAMGAAEADRWVKPESLAQVIVFLASEAARDLRGACIPVYGSA
jgi:NAD(P)-dependent dehydrogenase (short-subunit alcohol dehydrogenase family)